ncbi:response regulator [Larkinella arboricola]|uniref:Response regulator receiver domain-containing protein n=1 Tax=Larkinella arboricola TaxID=643671 RepID=A0A327WNK0_LARAB|nr:response regulator [Larkinella arboricola]RAJ92147.1 response regulator receiver domain-containing protein [Larkinella arboricola]
MEVGGPIVFIDDDEEDQFILKPILESIAPNSPILFFNNGEKAIDFLRTTDERPFLIISEVIMKNMSGLELRRQIEQDKELKKRSIPFIFFTHPAYKQWVEEAYELTIQGFFEKKSSTKEIKQQLEAIVSYWTNCLHPNRFDDE